MKLFSYQIPEVAHLPPSEREAILRHCAQSPRLAGYRKIAPKIVGGVLALAGIVFAFLGYSMFILLPAFTGVFLLLLIAKLGGEILFLRFEAKK